MHTLHWLFSIWAMYLTFCSIAIFGTGLIGIIIGVISGKGKFAFDFSNSTDRAMLYVVLVVPILAAVCHTIERRLGKKVKESDEKSRRLRQERQEAQDEAIRKSVEERNARTF